MRPSAALVEKEKVAALELARELGQEKFLNEYSASDNGFMPPLRVTQWVPISSREDLEREREIILIQGGDRAAPSPLPGCPVQRGVCLRGPVT